MRIRVFGQNLSVPLGALALIEATAFAACFYAGTMTRFGLKLADLPAFERDVGPVWPRAWLFSSVVLVSLLAFGLYSSRQRAQFVGMSARFSAAVLVALSFMAATIYIYPRLWFGRGVLALAAVCAVACTALLRPVFYRVVDNDRFKRRVILYGSGTKARAITQLRRRSDRRAFQLIGFVRSEGDTSPLPAGQLPELQGSLQGLCRSEGADEVVVAMDDRRRGFPISELLECRNMGVQVTELPTFLERETGRVPVDISNPSWMIFGDGFKRGQLRGLSTRTFDLLVSSLILVASLPLMLLTVLAIKLEDGFAAPVFFHQTRVGLGGQHFGILKFRSMRLDAERDGSAVWAQRRDPRATRVGSLIRRLRIDELPQILNVILGHMSFVGPRPERPQFVNGFAQRIPYYLSRHCVKPGITGWAQLCYPYGASEHDAIEKLKYDLYYIKNKTLLFDLAILLQTVEVVIMGKGTR